LYSDDPIAPNPPKNIHAVPMTVTNTTATLEALPLSESEPDTKLSLKEEAAVYPSAADATTMAHVRTAIDDLDRQIVTLLGP
jgi:hypothetical protein